MSDQIEPTQALQTEDGGGGCPIHGPHDSAVPCTHCAANADIRRRAREVRERAIADIADIIAEHVDPRPHNAPDDWNDGTPEAAAAIIAKLGDCEQCATYRDIFAEITAKAQPYCGDPADPERIRGYRIPCGPLHRAAGDLGFQMFDGEASLRRVIGERDAFRAILHTIAVLSNRGQLTGETPEAVGALYLVDDALDEKPSDTAQPPRKSAP